MWLQKLFQAIAAWLQVKQGPQVQKADNIGLDEWSRTQLADALLDDEKYQLDKVLSKLFGYHLLELSPFPVASLSSGSKINNRWKFSLEPSNFSDVVVRFEQLPVVEESMDVVVLHHALDYSLHPHQVLREASRVLMPRGKIVIVGFNPVSIMGLIKLFAQFFIKKGFWRRNSLGTHRVNDWLKLLNFQKISSYHGFFRPPVNNTQLLNKFSFLERLCRFLHLPVGSYYIVVACKDRVGVTPIRPFWENFKSAPRLIISKPSVTIVEPVHRASKDSNRSYDS
jgi:SAM-dependent methyltransferase